MKQALTVTALCALLTGCVGLGYNPALQGRSVVDASFEQVDPFEIGDGEYAESRVTRNVKIKGTAGEIADQLTSMLVEWEGGKISTGLEATRDSTRQAEALENITATQVGAMIEALDKLPLDTLEALADTLGGGGSGGFGDGPLMWAVEFLIGLKKDAP